MHWIDPDHLPEVSGNFERFLLNPHGEADGMMLTDGTEVHFPPHMAKDVRRAVNGKNAPVSIRGVRPRSGDLIAAVAIDLPGGQRIIDNGPPEKEKHKPGPKVERKPMTAEGKTRRVLHGPKGEVRGVLLDDGCIVRFPPHEAKDRASLLSPGGRFAARGDGIVSELGTVIEAHAIGTGMDDLRPLKPKKPKHEEPKHKAHGHGKEAAGGH